MRLVDPHHDRWHAPAAEEAAPAVRGHLLLTLEQWSAVRAHWPVGLPTGIVVPNTADVATIAHDVPRLALVVLQFPKWTDGRAYSQARLLRTRHRFTGELRAAGDVLVDMLPLLSRTGFDAARLRDDQDAGAAAAALGFFAAHYQADARAAMTLERLEAA